MNNQHISYFKVENFKRFDDFEMSNIGLFNLIVGDNNVGKTSLLESLTFDKNIYNFLGNIITTFNWRKIVDLDSKLDFNYVSLLFKNQNKNSLKYYFKDDLSNRINILELSTLSVSNLSSEELKSLKRTRLRDEESKYLCRLKYNDVSTLAFLSSVSERDEENYLPFIPFHTNTVDDLADFYSKQFQNFKSKRNVLIKNLQLFVSDIEDLEISTTLIPSTNSLIAWRKNYETPFLINLFGEGTIKTLRMLLEITVCKDKRLMVDEIDTGIHYSKMKEFWKIILLASKENNVQLFATTHSKECLQDYVEALKELQLESDSRIISLEELPDKSIKAYSFEFREFSSAIENGNELRGGS